MGAVPAGSAIPRREWVLSRLGVLSRPGRLGYYPGWECYLRRGVGAVRRAAALPGTPLSVSQECRGFIEYAVLQGSAVMRV